MVLDNLTLVAASAVGGAVYAISGYIKARQTEGESFELEKALKPVFYGAVIGIAGLLLAPQEIGNVGAAFAAGFGGSVLLEKWIGTGASVIRKE